jgi:RNA polymerase sigma-54 factor
MNSFNLSTKQKQTFQLSLRLWLPLLQSSVAELNEVCKSAQNDNPFLKYKGNDYAYSGDSYAKSGYIENTAFAQSSLYEKLLSQINPPLFPTPRSQKVAMKIVEFIDEEGFFDGDEEDIAIECSVTKEFVQSVRNRFKTLEPVGVGAKDLSECFIFQLDELKVDDELYNLCTKMIHNLTKIDKYHTHHRFSDASNVIKKFKNPPAIDYLADEPCIIPDFFVEVGDEIKVKINHKEYPDLEVRNTDIAKSAPLKEQLKEARDMVNLLELRKSTLYKLILVLVEKQMRFFVGGELVPMTMAEVAEALGFEESTISRAVSNKYLECDRGVLSLKSFFTNAVKKELSSSEVKNFIKQLLSNENREEPLTDQDIADKILARFELQMVRRTITKYRKQLLIPSSKERKKIYRFGG